jgi:UDP-glucose 4-epimerase
MTVVLGGAGFVGSHVLKELRRRNIEHVAVDNLATGHLEAVSSSQMLQIDLRDGEATKRAFLQISPKSVLLFAGSTSVGESTANPMKYYQNNVVTALNVLNAMKDVGCSRIIFSSSAAVYGEPQGVPITESHPLSPINPYGETKRMIECLLRFASEANAISSVSLRYFNAAGCDPDGELGEDHQPEEHLIPSAIDAALGRRPPLRVYGSDYPTKDGTCVRDYVHVADLAEAHVLALEHLDSEPGAYAFNLGSGEGYSVRDVIRSVGAAVGEEVPCRSAPRRLGDPAMLVASNDLAHRVLGWSPKWGNLEDMVEHAAKWRIAHPGGYAEPTAAGESSLLPRD